VLVAFDEPGREPLLEEMALPAVSSIEALGVETVEPVHRRRQFRPRPVGDHVVVRAEDRPGDQAQAEQRAGLGEEGREPGAVGVVEEDEDAARPTGSDVVDAVRKVASWAPRHAVVHGSRVLREPPLLLHFRHRGLSLGHVR
jgi:hypothetical protein